MKKIFIVVTFITLSAITIIACKKKEAADCTDLINKVNTAVTNYSSNQSTANCTALKTAYKNMLNCSAITGAQRTQYQTALDAINSLCP
jgi:hypothetical protein